MLLHVNKMEYWTFVPVFSIVMLISVIWISRFLAYREKRRRLKATRQLELELVRFNKAAYEVYNQPGGVRVLALVGDHVGAVALLSTWAKEQAELMHKERVDKQLI